MWSSRDRRDTGFRLSSVAGSSSAGGNSMKMLSSSSRQTATPSSVSKRLTCTFCGCRPCLTSGPSTICLMSANDPPLGTPKSVAILLRIGAVRRRELSRNSCSRGLSPTERVEQEQLLSWPLPHGTCLSFCHRSGKLNSYSRNLGVQTCEDLQL